MRLTTALILMRCLTVALTGCTNEPDGVSTTVAFAVEQAEIIGDDATANEPAPAVEIRNVVGLVGERPLPPRPAPRLRILPPRPEMSLASHRYQRTSAAAIRPTLLESYTLGAYASETQCERWAESQCRDSADMGCGKLHPQRSVRAAPDRHLCSPLADSGEWTANCYVRCVAPRETLAEE